MLYLIIILLIVSFYYHDELIVFLRGLNDSKSPQVSRTLFSILADLSNLLVWKVLAHPPIFNSSSFSAKSLESIPSTATKIIITITFMFDSSQARSKYLTVFFDLYSMVLQDSKVHDSAGSLFLVNYHLVKSSGQNKVICLHLKILKKCVCFILQYGFWFVHTLSDSMVKFL